MTTMTDEKRHPIRVAARRAGLTPDLLRAWEQRYEAVEPGRSPGGQRRYSDTDVERLRLLRLVTDAGRRIGDVVGLDDEALREMAREDRSARTGPDRTAPDRAEALLSECLRALVEFDASGLQAALARATIVLTPTRLVTGVVGPFMRRVGDLWQTGDIDPANEHMATVLVRGVLIDVLRALPPDTPVRRLVLATPTGERHEIGALLGAAVAAAAGWAVTYLGADLPAVSIEHTARTLDAKAVALGLVHPADPRRAFAEVVETRRLLPESVAVIVGGAAAVDGRAELEGAGVRVVEEITAFPGALAPR